MPSIFSLSMLIIATALLLVTVLSANAGNNKEHNVKHFTGVRREDFIEAGRAKASDVHELVFAINQLNLDKLEKEVINRATPGNKNYQKWLTFQQVGEMVTNKPAYEKVEAWLKTLPGVSVKKTSERLEYITVTAPISTWEAALKTEFLDWKDLSKKDRDGNPVVFARCKEYTIPTDLMGSLDHVFYTVQVPPRLNKKRYSRPEEAKNAFREESCSPSSGYSQATPSFLNNLYDITTNAGDTSLQQSVFETAEEYFSYTDLATFQKKYGLPSQAAVDHGGFDTASCKTVDCYEGNLDVQYMNAIAQNTPLIYYYVPDGLRDPFVVFATDLANSLNPPEVNSISWGESETEMDSSISSSFNTEAMKLGGMGVTITVSSGDNGAPDSNYTGTECLCPTEEGGSTGYNPSFPATSPWVTAVGATQGPTCGVRETVCMAPDGVITSGGGFSYLNNAPSWQTDNNAISDYFSQQSPVSGYNTTGRGYPDVAMLGVDFPVVVNGKVAILYGTSASSPLFAAMLTLVNTHRKASGQPLVGFINPTLYKAGHIGGYFQDITSGDNKCCAQDVGCCTTGFNAATGWDPTTGWGSMKLASMIAMFDNATAPAYDDDFYNDDGSSTSNIGLTAGAIAGVVIAAIIAVVIFGVVLVKCILPNSGKNNIPSADAQLTNPMYASKGGSGRVDV